MNYFHLSIHDEFPGGDKKIVNIVMPALADLFGQEFHGTVCENQCDLHEDKKLVELVEIFGFPSPTPEHRRAILSTSERKKCFQHAIVFNTCSACLVLCFYFSLALFNVSG